MHPRAGETMEDTYTAALQYASDGWPVFPLNGKHPRTKHGQDDATLDQEVIAKWWTEWPDADVGLLCKGAGVVVVDVDPRNGGEASLVELVLAHGSEWLDTVAVRTGGGGGHYYYKAPTGVRMPGKLATGIDLKANGYVVMPPSVHASGARYEWVGKQGPGEIEMLSLPAWMTVREEPAQARYAPQPSMEFRGPIGAGERNQTLTSMAGSMRRRGMSVEAIEAALLTENATRCSPPIREDEVRTIARSVGRYAPAPMVSPPSRQRKWWGGVEV